MTCAPQWNDSKSLLSCVPLFEGMKAGDLAHLVRNAREIVAPRGETLFRKGEECTGLYLIIFGQVKLFFTSPQGYEKIVDVLEPGRTLGEAALFQGRSHQVYAQALNSCLLLHIAKPVIMAELEKNPTFARRVIDCLAQRLYELTLDVESYSLDSGLQRVINFLMREALRAKPGQAEAESAGAVSATFVGGQNAAAFTLQTSKGVIASRLNLTQEHFSRLLHELSECGLLSVDGREIQLKDLARLRQYASRTRLVAEPAERGPAVEMRRAG